MTGTIPGFYDPVTAVKAQEAYCESYSIPMFIPEKGWCFNCGRNIFERFNYRGLDGEVKCSGIDVATAGSKLIFQLPALQPHVCGLTGRNAS